MQVMQVSMFSKFLWCGQDISKQPVARKRCRDDKALQITNAQDETCLWLFQGSNGGMTKIYSIRNTQDETVRSTMTLSRSPSLDVRCCATCLSLTFGIFDERIKPVSCMRMRPDTRQGPRLTWELRHAIASGLGNLTKWDSINFLCFSRLDQLWLPVVFRHSSMLSKQDQNKDSFPEHFSYQITS